MANRSLSVRKSLVAFRKTVIVPVARWHPGFGRVSGKGSFLPFSACFVVYGEYRIFRLRFSGLADKVLTVKVRFLRLIATFST